MAGLSRRRVLTLAPLAAACTATQRRTSSTQPPNALHQAEPASPSPTAEFVPAIVIHGGAGMLPKNYDKAKLAKYRSSLQRALKLGQHALMQGQKALDIVELVIRDLEDDPMFNAGKGAVLTANKTHELDASVMCGQTLRCGAVAGVTTVRHPITLARKVMEETRHVLLSGTGAETFATRMGVERVDPSYFLAPGRMEAYERAKSRYEGQSGAPMADDEKKGTVGVVVLDRSGHLGAGTSTGGLTYKQYGRVGDSPIVGAGTYADDRSCAVSCTGTGEEYIRHAVAHEVSARMRLAKESLQQAAQHVIHKVLKPGDGGLIAIDRHGNVAMPFNTSAMFRATANLQGHEEVSIWQRTPRT